MDISLPDIIGEYIDTPERYVTDGIQFAGYFEPETVAPGQATNFYLYVQNAYNATAQVKISLSLPEVKKGFFGGKAEPVLEANKTSLSIEVKKSAAGLLTVPMRAVETAETGDHELTIQLAASREGQADQVRPAKAKSKIPTSVIDSPVALNLVKTMGATYVSKAVKKATFPVRVQGKPQKPERVSSLEHSYETIWEDSALEVMNQAIHEINQRRVQLNKELGAEALYAALFSASTSRMADTGLVMRVGEAITLARILTYTAQYFLSSPDRLNGLLVPIWEHALLSEADTTEVLDVMQTFGYTHILRIAMAMSFNLIANTVGSQPWPLLERQAVTGFVSEAVEMGQPLETDFLYLPLLIGGVQISPKLTLPGENLQESLSLLHQAYQDRPNLFATAEMKQADQIYKRVLKKALGK